MSKFIEKLQQVFQPSAQSMGFQAVKAELRRPRIQLAVYITGTKAKGLTKEIEGMAKVSQVHGWQKGMRMKPKKR